MFLDHLQRVKDGVNSVYHLHNLAAYIEKNLILEGEKYKFDPKYSFQRDIINDTSRVTNTVKIAQIGLTTGTMAYLLSAAATQRKFNSIYALPSAGDATKLVTTKLNPLIQESPSIKRLMNKEVNNLELKEINKNFIYIRGTKSDTAALSISADCLVADEVDRCDPDVLKQFRSRLQASELQIVRQFSTPTINGVGISKEAEASKRYRHMATCYHCNHTWLPSYHTDIVIPGYTRPLSEIDKNTLKDLRWNEAHWVCPKCGVDPDLHPSRLQWVCENPTENYEAHTHYITPVTACLVLRPPYLVRTSTEFNTRAEWANQVLGETSEDENCQIVESDVVKSQVDMSLDSSEVHVMGVDVGQLCAVTIGREARDGTFIVVKREMVPLSILKERRIELMKEYKVVASVHDAFPETLMVTDICDYDPNAYGCIFIQNRTPELYTITEKSGDVGDGKLNLRLLKVNRTMILDEVLDLFKTYRLVMHKEARDFNGHYLSMKRTQVFVRDVLQFVWQKTDGVDHMHFSLAYALLAWKMRARVQWTPAGSGGLVSKFKMRQRQLTTSHTGQL
jgi:hypothetical protein